MAVTVPDHYVQALERVAYAPIGQPGFSPDTSVPDDCFRNSGKHHQNHKHYYESMYPSQIYALPVKI